MDSAVARPAESPPDVVDEALRLSRYLLPEARPLLRPGTALARRIADDYARALQRHRRPTLGQTLPGGRSLGAAALWAWEGAWAPNARRALVRQHLLLMSAILESQPELAPYFLPRHCGRVQVVWTLVRAAVATVAAALLSLGLRANRVTSRGA